MNSLNGFKVAILLTDGFEQVEMVKPRKALDDEGAQTFLISNKSKVQGWNHADKADSFDVDVLLEHADPKEFDALLLPGGVMNPDTLRMLPKAVEFTKKINEQQKPIAAICHGPWLLINAQAVKDRRITSWPSVKTDLINAGGVWVDQPVVQDGNLITSRKPDDIPEFNKALIKQFSDFNHKH
ncbi:type 1 glutamine amidotransferase [Fluoribacter dumoffii]|uniref:type 1 glutamine amidotransferase domain-containing protein n=1 Tax=Fluoribacter dumoffii TaxID=463 RepID=UPI0022435A39|nr:type 1 glutamine amidotransferase domain-containing protein [Fluoribacter dumoffii]MCW8418212.1 type 1 glutamine amidotransferase [Fluoribacter dumoffii]MCW8453946.1 type 1 glutamine amidotransferase [Fluoribacter dumoffii]MCW8461983.1 type 1 glutamine amidotransferase [Fluoribacter dumoffii]MCW8482195.1 type 1 glutamine amidotransferase [Fluoribacter dumoffii]